MQAELEILKAIQSLQCAFMDYFMIFISSVNNAGIICIVVAVVLCITKKYRKIGITLAVALIINTIFTNGIIKPCIARERPFIVDSSIQILISPPHGTSFPSGHTSSAFAVASVLMFYNRRFGTIAAIIAVLIGFSRLYLRVHFLTDVIAGAVLGIIYALFAVLIIKYIYKKTEDNKIWH
ncbi:MAG: phosphatase PAP2 family protein [Clostridia bacterium]